MIPPSPEYGFRESYTLKVEDRLYRFGLRPESATDLAQQAAEAERDGLPHGISVFSRSARPDAISALRLDIEEQFVVHKTGRNPFHYTIELPRPVTERDAAVLNRLFGRASRG